MPILRGTDAEYRYRVVTELVEVDGAIFGEIREFKTHEGAQKYADKHSPYLMQVGRLVWLTAEEQEAEIARLDRGEGIPR